MADYENLLDSIDAVIRSNNRREITGQILQNTLHQMVASLGENYQLAGFATPTLDPSEPDQNVFYLTDEAGVYTNFDNITLGNGLSFLMWKNGAWSSKTMNIVTAQWVDNNYVSKAFLRQMFRAYDEDGVEIFANDTTSIIDNIKAMCGLWTNQYLSALGLGADGGGGASTLAGLNDVQLDNLQDGQALVYDLDSFHWVNRTIQSGVDMSVVWAALAAATNEQINVSHLTTALSGYVTSTALATTLANYVTTTALASALADYAAQSWVETNYISKSFFNSLFQAEDSEGNAITPNNSGQNVIDRLKILVGAYTDQYLSALGLSEEAGASSYLYGLGDVQLDTQILAGGQALVYSASLGKWTNGEAGVNMVQVWTALATADATKQIDISHISSALSGYVTSSSLSTTLASYVTTSALSTTLTDYVTNTSLTTILAAYGTKSWVESNYISKAFFNRLFRAFAPVAEGESEAAQVEPNDVTTEIDNIKAMFGIWTEQYLSALGLGSDAEHTIGVLNDLNDVKITNPQNDQVLKYNNGIWVNAAAPSGATALSGLTDVAISSLADKDLLQWDYATGKWKNVVLSTVMSGYALASAIPTNVSQLNNDSGYITSAALSGYATTSQLANYLPLSGGVMTGNITFGYGDTTGGGFSTTQDQIVRYNGLLHINTRSNQFVIAKMGTNGLVLDISDVDSTKTQKFQNKDGTLALISDIPTNNNQLTNGAGYITSSGSCSYANSAGSVAWANVSGHPTTLSSFTNDSGYITSSALSSYLPLTGGTITGTIKIANSNTYQTTYNEITTYDNILHLNCRNNRLAISKMGTNGALLDCSRATQAIPIYFNANGGISPETPNSGIIGGMGYEWAETDSRVVFARHVNGSRTFAQSYNADLFLNYSADIMPAGNTYINANNAGMVGIGTTSPSYKLHVSGNIYATGGVTAASDERLKDIIADTELSVEQIANAPAKRFYWKRDHSLGEQVGSIAQYWQRVLPQSVSDKGDELGLQYGVAALISSITIARKVVNHEERIKALENENANLKQAYSFIKNAYDYLKMDYENLKLKIA